MEVWHSRFPGVDPSLAHDGRTITVLATTGSGCSPGTLHTWRFDARTGRPGHGSATSAKLVSSPRIVVRVEDGVVSVRGRPWHARVPSRGPTTSTMNAGNLVFVAMSGRWGTLCND